MEITSSMLDFFKLPHSLQEKVIARYMEYVKKPKAFVMQSHVRGKSQHMDFRMKVNNYLVGWSIVGGNVDNPITPKRLLEAKAKGFRAETKCFSEICNEWKYDVYEINNEFYYVPASPPHLLSIEELARQPLVWLKVEGIVKPGEPGAAIEAPGKFEILTSGQYITGSQKVWFHEYFLKDNKYFKDWTRIVVRAVRVARLDPKTKKPIKGQYERFWRAMIPIDQTPYAVSNRAIRENWKPPRNIVPFPEEWTKKKFPKKYDKWLEYMKGKKEKLSKNIKYTLALHKYRGPIHIRGLFRLEWYLFLDDKGTGQVRTFNIKGDPVREQIIEAWNEGRDSRKYLDWEGKTRPMSRFNPNKKIYGEMKILEKGRAEYESIVDKGEERIELRFKGKVLKGTWKLEQEEKGAESYAFYKEGALALSLAGEEYPFVYHRHYWDDREHYDLRWRTGERTKEEFNIMGNLLKAGIEEPLSAILKIFDLPPDMISYWMIDKGTKVPRKVGKLDTYIDVIDSGLLRIIERNPQFISMLLEGKKFKNQYIIAKKNNLWKIQKTKLPKTLAREGDPRTGSYYEPFIVERKKGWNYFIVKIYDIRNFTRCESKRKAKEYEITRNIPSGITFGICLYPRPGKIHGARIAYVKFEADKWNPDKAIKWIKENKLHTWGAEQVRKKLEQILASDWVKMKMVRLDLPGREVLAEVHTPEGIKEIIFRIWTDSLALKIYNEFVTGKDLWECRIYGGAIIEARVRKER